MLKKLLLFGLLLWPLLNAKVVVFRTNDSYNDRIAAFGPRLPESEEGLEGFLINVEILPELAQTVEDTSLVFAQEEELSSYLPHQGCKERQAPVDLSNSSLRWIALVERGGCSFVQKTLVAQRMGASGIIVGDNEKNSGLITMYPPLDDNYEWKVDQITIPAVFVKQWTYRELVFLIRPGSVGFLGSANLGRTSASSFVSIEDGLKIRIVKSEDFQWPLLDIIIVTVIAPIVIIVFLYSLYRFRRTRQLQFHLQNQENEEDTLTQEELEQIPIIIYRAPSDSIEDGDGDENSPLIAESSDRKSVNWDTCVVCLELFEDGDELRLFEKTCRHRFHVKCIDTWLSLGKSSACPICKRSIRGDPQEEGDHSHDEEVVDIVLVPATPSEQSPSQNVPSITVTPSALPSSTPQRSSSLRPSHVAVQIPSRVSTRILNASDMSASFHSSGAVTSASVDSYSSVMRLFGRSSTRR
jgi:E3 ubiquitin-protein ligase RNF13